MFIITRPFNGKHHAVALIVRRLTHSLTRHIVYYKGTHIEEESDLEAEKTGVEYNEEGTKHV